MTTGANAYDHSGVAADLQYGTSQAMHRSEDIAEYGGRVQYGHARKNYN
jgi:hypothetical protein